MRKTRKTNWTRALRGAGLLLVAATACSQGGGGGTEPLGTAELAGSGVHGTPATLAWPSAPAVAGGKVGSLPGSGRVGVDGQYSYTIPIDLPPGRAEMAPRLALGYSSSGDNGLLGVGWSLQGLSEIRPCPRTVAIDGYAEGVKLDGTDALCLDGERLMDVSGDLGTEFQTEADSFAKITRPDPDTFEVRSKDGTLRTYKALQTNFVLSSVRDLDGNVVGYFYDDLSTSSTVEYYLSKINYTGRYSAPGIMFAGKREVRFSYEGRPETVSERRVIGDGGHEFTIRRRLKTIEVWAPLPQTGTQTAPGLAWTYTLGYSPSANAGGRSLLTSVVKTGALGGSTLAKQFRWASTGGMDRVKELGVTTMVGGTLSSPFMVVDVDHDGHDDVVADYGGAHNIIVWRYAPSTTIAFQATKLTSLAAGTLTHGRVADLDGDNIPEFILPDREPDAAGDYYYRIYRRSSATSDSYVMQAGKELYTAANDIPQPLYVADLRGDGLPLAVKADHQAGDTTCYDPPDALGNNRASLGYPSCVMWNWSHLSFSGASFGEKASPFFVSEIIQPCGINGCSLAHMRALAPTLSTYDAYSLPNGSGKSVLFGATRWSESSTAALSPGTIIPNGAWDVIADCYHTDMSNCPIEEPFSSSSFGAYQGAFCAFGDFDGRRSPWRYCYDEDDAPDMPKPDAIRSMDLDGDGRDDIVAYSVNPLTDIPTAAWWLRWDHENKIVAQALTDIPLLLLDANGDGLTDFIGGTAADLALGNTYVYKAQSALRDTITEVWDEDGAAALEKVVYTQQWASTPQTATCAYPQRCARSGMQVVGEHDVYQGAELDAYARELYTYSDPRFDVRGRGFVGFTQVRSFSPDRPSETITTYDNVSSGPVHNAYFAFLPKLVVTHTPTQHVTPLSSGVQTFNVRTTQTTYHYSMSATNGGLTYFTHLDDWSSVELEQTAALDWSSSASPHFSGFGAPTTLRKRSGERDYDAYGNVIYDATETTGGIRKVVRTTMAPVDTARWLVARPGTVRIDSYLPAPADTLPQTRTVDYVYDPAHPARVREIQIEKESTDPAIAQTITYQRNADGLVISTTVTAPLGSPASPYPLSRTSQVTYDPEEGIFPRTFTDALNHTTEVLVHPAFGVASDAVDVNGVESRLIVDDLGRPRSTWRAGSATVNTSMATRTDANGLVIGTNVTTQGAGVVTSTVSFDLLGRHIVNSHIGFDGNNILSATTYDILGRVASRSRPGISAPSPFVTTYAYDSLNRPLTTHLPDDNTIVYWHSFLESHAYEPLGNESYVVRDVDGRVVQSVQVGTAYSDVATRYDYGYFDKVTEVTDPRGNVSKIEYDLRGRVTYQSEPNGGPTTTEYNAFGEAVTVLRHKAATTYSYDALGRVTQAVNADGTAVWNWDTQPNGVGALASAVSPDGTTTELAYDAYGRQTRTTWTVGGEAFSMDVGYDVSGRLSTLEYPSVPGRSRFAIQRNFTGNHYLQSVTETDAPQLFFTVNARNEDGALLLANTGDGLTESRTYDPRMGRLAGIEDGTGYPIANAVQSLAYHYDANGDVKSRSEIIATHNGIFARGEVFDYDPLHRLIGWDLTSNGVTKTTGYSYDAIGNMTQVTTNGVVTETNTYGCTWPCLSTASYPHQLQTQTIPGGGILPTIVNTFTYDERGRQQTAPGRTGVTYTELDLPRSIKTSAGTTSFLYDADHARVKKTAPNGDTTITLAGLYERRVVSGETQHIFYVPSPDGLLAQVEYTPSNGATSVTYVHRDLLGSGSVITQEGAVSQRLFYDPFGKRIHDEGTTYTPTALEVHIGFTGHEADDDLGLINMKGRLYDPSQRHFLSVDPHVTDPLNAQSYNRYSYVMNNPARLTDPTGFDWWGPPDAGPDSPLWIGWPTTYDQALAGTQGPQGTSSALSSVPAPQFYGTSQPVRQRSPAPRPPPTPATPNAVKAFGRGFGPLLGPQWVAPDSVVVLTPVSSAEQLGGGVTFGALHAAAGMFESLSFQGQMNTMSAMLEGGVQGAREDGLIGGVAGTLNPLNPLYQVGVLGAEVKIGADQGDWYRVGNAAGAMGVVVGSTVLTAGEGKLADLGEMRSSLGVQAGEGTLTRLDVGGKSFYGINGHGQSYSRPNGVTFQSLRHAEGDAFGQAIQAGATGEEAVLYVDRAVCGFCKSSLKGYARALGVKELIVVEPDNTFTVKP